jgi:hypothetical protein
MKEEEKSKDKPGVLYYIGKYPSKLQYFIRTGQ